MFPNKVPYGQGLDNDAEQGHEEKGKGERDPERHAQGSDHGEGDETSPDHQFPLSKVYHIGSLVYDGEPYRN